MKYSNINMVTKQLTPEIKKKKSTMSVMLKKMHVTLKSFEALLVVWVPYHRVFKNTV